LAATQAPSQRGWPWRSQDLSGSHSTQKAPDAVHPGGQARQVPDVLVVTHRNWIGVPTEGHTKEQDGLATAGKSQNCVPHWDLVSGVQEAWESAGAARKDRKIAAKRAGAMGILSISLSSA